MVQTTLTAPFSERAAAAGLSLSIELDPGFSDVNVTPLRQYPGVNAKLVASFGTVRRIGVVPETVEREVLQFSGGDTSSTRRPIRTLTSSRTFGSTFDEEGNAVAVSFSQDGFQIKASKPFYGAVEVAYETDYAQLEYRPLVVEDPVSPAVQVTFGAVLAFFEGLVTVFQVPAPDPQDGDFQEAYRIVSEMIANELGTFEKPPGWTGQTGSPTWPSGDPDPDEPFIPVRRPHEIGYVTSQGSTFTRSFFVPTEEPQTSSGASWTPELAIVESPGGGPFDDALALASTQEFIAAARERIA